jgi:hypothetical protein
MPKNVDNSGGGQVWVTSGEWGPFKGDLLHMSYGQSALYKVLKEEVNGQVQGGVVRIPVRFSSSAMRARFNAKDGQLYVSGLRGWQSNAAKDGGFDRVRYTGTPATLPTALNATSKGMRITFTDPVDRETAGSTDSWSVEVWNYRWTAGYGSGEYTTLPEPADTPKDKRRKRDVLAVKSAKVSEDARSVFLEIDGMKPVMQMKIAMQFAGADQSRVKHEIYNTIHELGQ